MKVEQYKVIIHHKKTIDCNNVRQTLSLFEADFIMFDLVSQIYMHIHFFLFCPFLGIAQLTLGMNVSSFLCVRFTGRCN